LEEPVVRRREGGREEGREERKEGQCVKVEIGRSYIERGKEGRRG
jgi:hypothetical protein